MKLRTEVTYKDSDIKYGYNNHFMLMGSCFSDEIGQKLIHHKFRTTVNPYGTIFNPISLFEKIEKRNSVPEPKHFLQKEDLWFNYDYHTHLYGKSQKELIKVITLANQKLRSGLETCDLLVLTLGTAFVHELNESEQVISNCHKQPNTSFTKKLLSVGEIVSAFKDMYNSLNRKPQILLTVSPVRHTKEGLEENQLSKSILRVACNEIKALSKNINYFPSYEVVIDDLRDYRFYKQDLIHPTEQAVEYIFENFVQTHLDTEALKILDQVKKIQLELNHRPLDITSDQHQKFFHKLLLKMESITIDFATEIKTVKSQLL